jgi:diguanylate cyclase
VAARHRTRQRDTAAPLRRLRRLAVVVPFVPLAPLALPSTPAAARVPALLGALVALLLVALLRRQAGRDPLTGLPNRAALTRHLAPGAALLVLDLDGFADVNDAYGHRVADDLLVQAAARLRAAGPALLARVGGDKFAAVYPDGRCNEAAARRVLASLRSPYRIGARDLYVTASAGLVRVGADPAEALRDADLALDEARTAGRDRVARFQARMRRVPVQRRELADGLREALRDSGRGGLDLAYQPVVDLMNGRVVAAEALLRWRRGDGEPVAPAQFVPVAERTGLIVPLGWWVLGAACSRVRDWHRRYGVAVTVNVSPVQLREPDFAERVLAIVGRAGVPGTAVVLEVTESTLLSDPDRVRAALQALRTNGIRIAVDDFGTGYSALSHLTALPVDVLKLDRAFVGGGSGQRAIAGAVLRLAADLELTTIAEGVETGAQARALRSLGCPLAQGFLYSPPVPAPALGELLARWNPATVTARRPAPA